MVCKSIYAKLLFFSFRAKEIGDKILGITKKSFLEVEKKICIFAANILYIKIMTTFALNNLWAYIQGLSLTSRDRDWLADKLINANATAKSDVETAKAKRNDSKLSPEIEFLGSLNIVEPSKEVIDNDPKLAEILK